MAGDPSTTGIDEGTYRTLKRDAANGTEQTAAPPIVLWLGALGQKWGVELPSIRDHEEASPGLSEKIGRWEAEILQAGRQEGRQEGRLEAIEGSCERESGGR